MTLSIEPLTPVIGARITGVDLAEPLQPEDARTIKAALDRHAILVLPCQDITDEQQQAFTQNFGPIENPKGNHVRKPEEERLGVGMIDVSNLTRDGKPYAKNDRHHLFNMGNMLWHSDSSFRAVPAAISILSARVVNPVGGNTEFASMRAAYDDLDPAIKDEIEDYVCEHSLMYSRGQLGIQDFSNEERAMFKPVRQRLVRRHPSTGAKSLYLSSHAGDIVGLEMPMARIILRDLNDHATQPKYVYRHQWQANDLVMWDNQQTMHRVRRYDESYPRDMRRTTVAGEAMTAEQAA